MSAVLTVRRGKEPIMAWRRKGWQSMVHSVTNGSTTTRCGRHVELGHSAVDAIVLTQVEAKVFLTVGCGLCSRLMLRELHAELSAADPDAKVRLKAQLRALEWTHASNPD